jgi:hypothetical protein
MSTQPVAHLITTPEQYKALRARLRAAHERQHQESRRIGIGRFMRFCVAYFALLLIASIVASQLGLLP